MLILMKNDYICNLNVIFGAFFLTQRQKTPVTVIFCPYIEWPYRTILKIYNHYGKFRLSDADSPYLWQRSGQ